MKEEKNVELKKCFKKKCEIKTPFINNVEILRNISKLDTEMRIKMLEIKHNQK